MKNNMARRKCSLAEKVCIGCRKKHPAVQFRDRKGGYLESRCKDCERIHGRSQVQKRRIKSPGYWREPNRKRRLMQKYGITIDGYNELLRQQDNKCAICQREKSQMRDFAVDHHHATGKVRGILCSPCNVGLGMFRDKPDLMLYAAIYLTETKTKEYANL